MNFRKRGVKTRRPLSRRTGVLLMKFLTALDSAPCGDHLLEGYQLHPQEGSTPQVGSQPQAGSQQLLALQRARRRANRPTRLPQGSQQGSASQPQAGSAPQVGSTPQVGSQPHAGSQQLLALQRARRRANRPTRPHGSQQGSASQPQAGSAPQVGSAASQQPHPDPMAIRPNSPALALLALTKQNRPTAKKAGIIVRLLIGRAPRSKNVWKLHVNASSPVRRHRGSCSVGGLERSTAKIPAITRC